MNDQHDLTVLIKSRVPIIIIETREEPRVLALLEKICNLHEQALFVWSIVDGLRRSNKSNTMLGTNNLVDCLKHVEATPQNGVYALFDAHPFLQDPINVRLVRQIAMGYGQNSRTLVFVSPRFDIPDELKRLSARFALRLPDVAGIRVLLKEEAELYATRSDGERLRGQQEAVEILVQHLVGLPLEDARRLIRLAIDDDGDLNLEDLPRVLRAKRELLDDGGILDLQFDCENMNAVGGLSNLKRWLSLRRAPFLDVSGSKPHGGGMGAVQKKSSPAQEKINGAQLPVRGTVSDAKLPAPGRVSGAQLPAPGRVSGAQLPAPRGVMLLGVQGGGKSLAAKAVAGAWSVPLLRLDFGALYNKFLGETERNLREVLRGAEAMAPCVLWIDEIEKGLATDEMEGASRRVLGTLLTWMNDRTSRVFLVATANDVTALPPELLRKGRFDELFFVDLPDTATRAEILSIHLRRRQLDVDQFDVQALAQASDGFSGAELEQAIVAALYEAYAAQQPLDTRRVLDEIGVTKPLSVLRAEDISALREWARERTVPAN